MPSSGAVRQVEVPRAAMKLTTLPRVHYEDAFLLEAESARDRTGEEWARAMLEGAPTAVRHVLRSTWSALGLELAWSRSDRHVLGWEVRQSTRDFALLGAGGRLGLEAELLFKPRRSTLLFATFVQQTNGLARAMWAGIEPAHGPVVRHMLEQAGRRVQA